MNKPSLLAMSILLALSGCNSSNDSDGPTTKTLTAIDGYLINAKVIVDTNNNMVSDNDDITLGRTDENGQYSLSLDYEGASIFIEAVAGETVDSTRGQVTQSFTLAANSGSNVVSPITTMVMELLASDPSLDVVAAEQQVIDTMSDLGVDSNLIFDNYLKQDSEAAVAVKIIGEQLVDTADLDIDRKLELTKALSTELKSVIADTNSTLFDDYYPIVDIPTDSDHPITVTVNHRPKATGVLDNVTMTLGEDISPLDVSSHFSDQDTDPLTYSIEEISNLDHSLTIDTSGVITGSLSKAGTFNFEIIATDSASAKSYPLNLTVQVQSLDNAAPVLSQSEHARIQSLIDEWQLFEGEVIDYNFNLNALFEDADQLTVRADSTLSLDESGEETGFSMTIVGDLLTFNSSPPRQSAAGQEKLYVFAKDNVNAEEVHAVFNLPAIQEGSPSIPDDHLLESKFWHFSDVAKLSDDSVVQGFCDTIYFDKEDQKAYITNITISNKNQCASQERDSLDLSAGISYVREGWSTLKSTNYEIDGISFELISTGWDQGDTDYATVRYSKRDLKSDQIETVVLTYYSTGDVIEDTLLQPVSIGDDVTWASKNIRVVSEYDDGGATAWELSIDAAIREYEIDGVTQTTATLRTYGQTNCDRLESIYLHGLSMMSPNSHFSVLPEFNKTQNLECTANLHGPEGTPLPLGTYTFNVYPVGGDYALHERMTFSFLHE